MAAAGAALAFPAMAGALQDKTGSAKPSVAQRSLHEFDRLFAVSDADVSEESSMNGAHQFSFDGLLGGSMPLSALEGRAVLVVNTASQCGFTPQYEGLQELYETYADKGLVIIGVPSNDFGGQEPGDAEDIASFCSVNYGVTFPMASKTKVIGSSAHPLYKWAEETIGAAARPRWNFHKILIAPNGDAVEAFASSVSPQSSSLKRAIEAALPDGS